jgi:protein tyrosine/serine phosphatase
MTDPDFETLDNFRDFGGARGRNGRQVRRGLLYRSAHHARASDKDLQALSILGLAALVDLRRTEEREREPNRTPEASATAVILNDIAQEGDEPFTEFLKTSDLSPQAMRDYLAGYYANAPFEPRHIDLYGRYFKVLASADGPVLIHCAAGKDRTGILAALTLHLLSVPYEDALADYLKTNDEARMAKRAPLLREHIETLTGRVATDEALYAVMGVEARYLDIAFEAMAARYGSIDAYLEKALGVDAALKAEIEARLLH